MIVANNAFWGLSGQESKLCIDHGREEGPTPSSSFARSIDDGLHLVLAQSEDTKLRLPLLENEGPRTTVGNAERGLFHGMSIS